MKRLKVNFVDFWDGFVPQKSFIYELLSLHYELYLVEQPDYLFFSCFGNENVRYVSCIKIFFTGENMSPDFNECDYAMAFDHITFGDRYLRLPLFYTFSSFEQLKQRTCLKRTQEELLNRKFCSYVVSNKNGDIIRNRFYKLLNEYKKIDCGGQLYNNVGGPVANKLNFISEYKFNISFENSKVYGYTTEKLMESFVSETLPIYWGNPLVGQDFNIKSFINVHDFNSLEDAVDYVIKVDNDENLYLSYFCKSNVIDEFGEKWEEHFVDFCRNIFDRDVREVRYLTDNGFQSLYRKKQCQGMSYYDKVLKIKKALTKVKMQGKK